VKERSKRSVPPAPPSDAMRTSDGEGEPPPAAWLRSGRRPWVSMVDIAYEALVEAISDGGLAPGTHLDIREAAERLGMSPTPVREALARLNTHGLIGLDANRGYRVSGVLTAPEFHQLYAARRVIEFGALRQSGTIGDRGSWIELMSEKALDEVLDLERAARSSPHGPRYADYAGFSRADALFHGKIVGLAGNRFLAEAWTRLHCHLHVSRLYAGTGVIDFDDARVEHAAIVEALVNRDVEALLEASALHMDRAETRLGSLVR
jgi:DNA-binding GntR family transcriptional regulator